MAWVEPRGNRFRGRYRAPDGRRLTAGTSASKREALRMAMDKEAEIHRGSWHDPSAGKMLFADYFELHWLPNRVAARNTIATYRSHFRSSLEPAFGQVELRRITRSM